MKRFLSLIMVIFVFFVCTIPTHAENIEEAKILEQNIENAASYAESFIKEFTQSSNYVAGNVITIRNVEDKVAGFCVDILRNNKNNGYVIIKFVDNEPVISEFCVEKGAHNPYTTIIDNYDILCDKLQFYSFGANDYQIYDEYSKTAYSIDNENISEKKYKSNIVLTRLLIDNLFEPSLNYSGLDGWSVVADKYEGTIKSSKTITGAENISYYNTTTVSKKNLTYACSVVALSNLMKYYRSQGYTKIPSNFKKLYNNLWKKAETSSTGITNNGKEPKAAIKYLSEVGYKCSYSSFKAYNKFVSNLNLNKPCLFTYGAKFDGKNNGHAVLVVGYVETSSYKYLKVADGWNSYLRYINFNGYSYSRKNGWAFNISN